MAITGKLSTVQPAAASVAAGSDKLRCDSLRQGADAAPVLQRAGATSESVIISRECVTA